MYYIWFIFEAITSFVVVLLLVVDMILQSFEKKNKEVNSTSLYFPRFTFESSKKYDIHIFFYCRKCVRSLSFVFRAKRNHTKFL